MTRFDRRALFASGAAAALLVASGISAQARPERGGRLRAALSAVPGEAWHAPDPSHFRAVARHAVLEGLTEIAADGTLRGNLATSWDSPDGGYSWRFHLRDARWHDGSAVEPEQVASVLGGFVHGRAVVLTSPAPEPGLPMRLAQPDKLVAHPTNSLIGTGLYALTAYEAGRRAIVERLENHSRVDRVGWVDVVDLTGMSSEDTRLDALVHDMVDLIDHGANTAPPGINRIGAALVGPALRTPPDIGAALPLDNWRCAERWWLA